MKVRPWIGKILRVLWHAVIYSLMFCFLAVLVLSLSRGNSFHAELSMANLDCSQPLVCHYHPNQPVEIFGVPFVHGAKYQINALGYRGPLPSVERDDPRELRVFVFGDSMTMGIGVDDDETLAQNLQRLLQQALPGRKVVVSNFGMVTTYLISNLRSYSLLARPYQPDVVIFAEDRLSPHDMNYRIREMRSSALLGWLVKSRFGAELVGRYENTFMTLYSRSAAEQALREQFEILADDQADHGTVVMMFHFFQPWALVKRWGDSYRIAHVIPPRLRYLDISSGLTQAEYRASRWMIPGDGHPSAEGQRYFAGLIEEALVPLLRSQGSRH